ncbi:MAG: DEIH-box ATPase [Chaenotheca gracillima]|nr:MAG: DEIH-box ATPase [Chaenotheca gracillima]
MVKVLVLGATGYIGEALCASLLRSSHVVYGLARSEAKAKQLASQEITPVSGSIPDSTGGYLDLIRTHSIDVAVDCSGAYLEAASIVRDLQQIGRERLEAHKKAGLVGGPKLGFIYIGGTWVHGTSNETGINDLTPVGTEGAPAPPAKVVAWRPELERTVLASRDVLDVCIVRPGLVYGRSTPLFGLWLGPVFGAIQAKAKEVSITAEPNTYLSLIHVDDVGLGIHKAVEKVSLLAGTGVFPVFDLVTSRESLTDILQAAAKLIGFEGEVKLVGAGENAFAAAMCTSSLLDSGRARQLLDWKPRFTRGLFDRLEVVVKAHQASS